MLDVEVIDHERLGPEGPSVETIELWCRTTAASRGVNEGHVAVEIADEARISELNARHRGRASATDVLAFPIDGVESGSGPRELGDVVVCPPRVHELREAIVHGMLHLLGMDHERDEGEMLALQARLLATDTK